MEEDKVIISFGARNGGFELAWALKREIDYKFQKKIAYLDAISLESDSATHYTWDNKLGIWKMSNENWYNHYKDTMDKCSCMIFMITKEWLESYYCWQEWEMFLKEERITPIFLFTQEAFDIIRKHSVNILTTGGKLIKQDLRKFHKIIEDNNLYIY